MTTIISTQILTSIISTSQEITLIVECPEKCERCDEQSNNLNLCIKCNINNGFYPVNYNNNNPTYIDCMNFNSYSSNSNLLNKLFFNPKTKEYNLCYETCKTCESSGDPSNHNCLTRDEDHQFLPTKYPSHNCVTQCKYYYYFTFYDQYKCTPYPQCPEEAKLFIKEKNKCIDDCLKDNDFKYQFNGNCLKECPEDTIKQNYICKQKDKDVCSFSQKELNYLNLDNNEGLENIVKSYSEEFSYTNKHISQYVNNDYNMILLKNSSCVTELDIKIANIEFNNCINKVKNNYNIEDDLIIAILENYNDINLNNPITSFSLFDPKTGKKLEAMNICLDDTIIINENLISFLNKNDTNFDILIDLLNQNINIFDIESDFYTDLCFFFISPIKKDIPLKDRLLDFYPNISLCDSGCKNIGVNFTTKSAIYECKYKDIVNNKAANNDILSETTSKIVNIIGESNIEVLKCLSYAFKHFNRGYGGYIVISLYIFSITSTIFFYLNTLSKIKLYIYNITQNFLSLLTRNKNNIQNNLNSLAPPKKEKNSEKSSENISKKKKKVSKFKNEKYDNLFPYKEANANIEGFTNKSTKRIITQKNENNDTLDIFTNKSPKKKIIKKKEINDTQDSFTNKSPRKKIIIKEENKDNLNDIEDFNDSGLNGNNEEFFQIYLSKKVEEMDFHDAYKYDKRTFFEIFYDLILNNVITINTFFEKEPIRPLILKVVIYFLYINLFFIVNGFFYSEEYISKVYHLEKNDKFFSFVPRSTKRFIYTIFIGTIMQFIIKCLFIEERRIKRIFIREKDNIYNLKYEIFKLMSIMNRRLLAFFVITFIIFIFSFLYVISFNYVYHFTQFEWIKSSIFIIIILELCNTIICLICSGLRLGSFKSKSDRLYKLSNLYNSV